MLNFYKSTITFFVLTLLIVASSTPLFGQFEAQESPFMVQRDEFKYSIIKKFGGYCVYDGLVAYQTVVIAAKDRPVVTLARMKVQGNLPLPEFKWNFTEDKDIPFMGSMGEKGSMRFKNGILVSLKMGGREMTDALGVAQDWRESKLFGQSTLAWQTVIMLKNGGIAPIRLTNEFDFVFQPNFTLDKESKLSRAYVSQLKEYVFLVESGKGYFILTDSGTRYMLTLSFSVGNKPQVSILANIKNVQHVIPIPAYRFHPKTVVIVKLKNGNKVRVISDKKGICKNIYERRGGRRIKGVNLSLFYDYNQNYWDPYFAYSKGSNPVQCKPRYKTFSRPLFHVGKKR